MQLWFTEEENEAVRLGFRIENVVYRGKSEFQSIEIIETAAYGNMLLLDGCVMTTDHDEFVYHESIAHIPICLHQDPKHVLVIGGGDGGTIRELLRHDCVEKAVLCEIDGLVVDVCKKYFPKIAGKLDDPRCEVRIGDGVGYVKEHENAFDIIIIDSTDPVGPGEGLFTGEFYKSVARALKPGGVMVAQSESPWYPKEFLTRIQKNIRSGFSHSAPYVGSIPTYPRGLWSWTMASEQPIKPAQFNRERFGKVAGEMQYLTPERAVGAFDLPPFFAAKL